MVTNKGNLSYIVKSSKYDYKKAINIINKAIDIDIKAKKLKNKIEALNYFLSNCSKCGIYYSKCI